VAGDALTGRWPAEVSAAGEAPERDDEEMPRVVLTRRRVIGFAIFVLSAVAFMYFVLPRLGGLGDSWNRIDNGYVALFRAVFVRGESRIDWRESYQITMAGVAATRLFAAAGAGGIALTAWALRRSGLERRLVACRMIAFMVLLYAVFMIAVVVCGIGLRTGLFPGAAPFAITIVPAILGVLVIGFMLAMSLLPDDFERRFARWAAPSRQGRIARFARRGATVPASVASGVRTAIALVRSRDPALLGAAAWWAFDIAVLWACFRAFGQSPEVAVIVMAYFVGQLGNTLPLPGGVGGVEGGLIGAFAAFGMDVDVAIVSVLAYRAFNFWLPTLPGVVAYLQLRRTVQRWRAEPASA
jgi:uncharacterized protein (TIRG00374 family)